jgi:hypothetical protein
MFFLYIHTYMHTFMYMQKHVHIYMNIYIYSEEYAIIHYSPIYPFLTDIIRLPFFITIIFTVINTLAHVLYKQGPLKVFL